MTRRERCAPKARPMTALRKAVVVMTVLVPTLVTLVASHPYVVGGAAVCFMLVLIFMRVHVGVALALPGALGLYSLYGWAALKNTLAKTPFEVMSNWEYSVIPTFILMGLLLWRSGATTRIYDVAMQYLRWLPGGPGLATVVAGTGLAATSGSTVGSVYALSRIAMPEMLRYGMNRAVASGTVVMTGLIGQLIPPSVFLVIYAGIAEVSVGPQLLAGIVPGGILAGFYVITIVLAALVQKRGVAQRASEIRLKHFEVDNSSDSCNPGQQVKNQAKVSIVQTWPLALVILVIIGGIYSGLLTATEAGAAGALLGVIILFLLLKDRQKAWLYLRDAGRETVTSTGAIFLILIGSTVLSRLLAVTGLSRALGDWLSGDNINKIGFLVILAVLYLVLGMFMDPLSILLLTVPLLLPSVAAFGIDQFWFGVYVVLLAELSIVTPPVGVLVFIFHGIAKNPDVNLGNDIALVDVFKGAALFIPAALLVLAVMILSPTLVTFLIT